MANKRILFFLPGLELGGAERQALYLARHLKNLGCDIRVWANNGPGLASALFEEQGVSWKIQPSTWPCRKQHYLRFLWRVFRTVQALRIERPDVILSYCPRPSISSGLSWRLSSAKVFIWGQRDTGDLRGDLVERYAYRRSSAVICNAEHEVEYLKNTLGNTKAPIFVVHNGLELSKCKKSRKEWRGELNIPMDSIVATMVANFRYQKDHQTLLLAWKQVLEKMQTNTSRPYLLLAGAYQESYRSIFKLAIDLGLVHSIKFLGQVQDISGLLKTSDIGSLISFHEGLPNAVLEYMAIGLPVVATDLPGNREVLGDVADDQLCRACDEESIAERLLELIRSPDQRRRLGDLNRQRATCNFSVESMCLAMTEIVIEQLTRFHK